MSDVLSYVAATLSSTTYIEPATNVNKHIMYTQLFEELKTVL